MRTPSMLRQARIFRLVAVAVLVANPGAALSGSSVELGHAIVQANCARCHAIGLNDASTHPEAPPFRTLSNRYPLHALEEAFAEGISTGHPDMPEFVATPVQIRAIIDYIASLER